MKKVKIGNETIFRENTKLVAVLLLRYSGMSRSNFVNLIFGCNNTDRKKWNIIKYNPERLTVKQVYLIYSLLHGKFSLPVIFALCAGYSYNNIPESWLNTDLPCIPPELLDTERADITVKELEKLKKKE